MPEEIEIETKDLQETIDEIREQREERAVEAKTTAWIRGISLSTALFAVIAAVAALQAGSLVNEALLQKNESVLKQAQASDQWAYYQSAGIKGNTAKQTAAILAAAPGQGAAVAFWNKEADRYSAKKDKAQADARGFETQRDDLGEESKVLLTQHEVFAFCVTLTQVSIALSAIAALTRRKPVWYVSLLVGIAGLVWFANGYINKVTHAPRSEHAVEHAGPAEEKAAPSGGKPGKAGTGQPVRARHSLPGTG